MCILQVSDVIVSALNQNLVEFELKPGIRVIVYNTQLTLGKKHFFLLYFHTESFCAFEPWNQLTSALRKVDK